MNTEVRRRTESMTWETGKDFVYIEEIRLGFGVTFIADNMVLSCYVLLIWTVWQEILNPSGR